MTTTMSPPPGKVGTIIEFPKKLFMGSGGIGNRYAIVTKVEGSVATMERWSKPSKGWRRHVRKTKGTKRCH